MTTIIQKVFQQILGAFTKNYLSILFFLYLFIYLFLFFTQAYRETTKEIGFYNL